MKAGYLIGAMALSIGLAGSPAILADITPVNFPSPMPPGTSVSGVVTNIDPVNRQVQVREASGMIQTVRVDEHIELLRNGQPIRLVNISLGDNVTVVSNR